MHIEPVFVFDLDGTLVDSVYHHVFAWREALEAEGISLSFWHSSESRHERRTTRQPTLARNGR